MRVRFISMCPRDLPRIRFDRILRIRWCHLQQATRSSYPAVDAMRVHSRVANGTVRVIYPRKAIQPVFVAEEQFR
jgi:hypothetical protein